MGEDQIWNQASKSSPQNNVCTGALCLNPCAAEGELHVPSAQLSFLLLTQHRGPNWTGSLGSTFPAAGPLGSLPPAIFQFPGCQRRNDAIQCCRHQTGEYCKDAAQKDTPPSRSGQAGRKAAFIDIRSWGEISVTTETGWGLIKNVSFLRIFLTHAAQALQTWDRVRFSSLFDFPLLLKVFLH